MIRYGICLLFFMLYAQADQLEHYIADGLKNNLALRQKEFSYQRSIQALNEARGSYFPSLDILARYSRAGGGRTFEMPIGDIANPIYDALDIPVHLPNTVVPFLRPEEQETKVRLIQPLFQPAIHYNYKMRTELKEIDSLAVAVYQRYLVSEIKIAYYNWLMSLQVINLLKDTRQVLEENVRVSEHLYHNGKVTRDAVYRAQAELSSLDQNVLEAENRRVQSRSYFNFLLNRPLETAVLRDETTYFRESVPGTYEQLREEAWRNREELQQMGHALAATDMKGKIIQSAYLPGLAGIVEYGFEGEQYRFSDKHDYWMASLALEWNLFKGFQDKAKREQNKLAYDEIGAQDKELRKKIALEVRQIADRCQAALQKIESAQQQEISAQASFKIIRKKYEQGMTTQIEFLDARSNLTESQVKIILARFEFQVNAADLERALADYPLKSNHK
jgi:outer membrane protein